MRGISCLLMTRVAASFIAPLTVAAAVAGCGGGGGDPGQAAFAAVKPVAIGKVSDATDSATQNTLPNVLTSRAGRPVVTLRSAREEKNGTVDIRARYDQPVTVRPYHEYASAVRGVPAGGYTVTLHGMVLAQARKDANGKWQTLQAMAAPLGRALAPPTDAERQQATETAQRALRALFTFDGDVAAYDRAQSLYLSPPGSKLQPPTLGFHLRGNGAYQSSDGPVWKDESGGLSLGAIEDVLTLPALPGDSSAGHVLRLKRMAPVGEVSAHFAPPDPRLPTSPLITTLVVAGRTRVRVGDFAPVPQYGVRPSPPVATTGSATYTATLVHVPGGWAITRLELGASLQRLYDAGPQPTE